MDETFAVDHKGTQNKNVKVTRTASFVHRDRVRGAGTVFPPKPFNFRSERGILRLALKREAVYADHVPLKIPKDSQHGFVIHRQRTAAENDGLILHEQVAVHTLVTQRPIDKAVVRGGLEHARIEAGNGLFPAEDAVQSMKKIRHCSAPQIRRR
jgi:hypothetical protein